MRRGDQQTSPKMVTFEQRPAGEGRNHTGVGGKRIRGWGGGEGRAEALRPRLPGDVQLEGTSSESTGGAHTWLYFCVNSGSPQECKGPLVSGTTVVSF